MQIIYTFFYVAPIKLLLLWHGGKSEIRKREWEVLNSSYWRSGFNPGKMKLPD